jgi:hypothetical protein
MTDRQRELKRERDRRYREKKKAARVETPRRERWNPARVRREVIDILRTEIRLRHRHAAAREIEALETRVKRRLDDAALYGVGFNLSTFQNIEAFADASRKELYEASGQEWNDDCVDYGDEE